MVEWAPLNIPMERRLQTLAVLLFWPMQIWCLSLFCVLFWYGVWTRIFCLAYLVWMFTDKGPVNGGWEPNSYAQQMWLWYKFRDYFPIKLIKTANIPTNRPAIFGYHPHSVLPLGCWVNLATQVTGFGEKFPGISMRVLTLKATFRLPFFREISLLHGLADCSRESIEAVLSKGGGNAVTLVVGGAQEALDTHPGTFDLTLKNRKGFVKQALKYGASLVPVCGFGDNDVFRQVKNPKGSRLRNFQDTMQKKMGFSLPLFWGRGVFQYSFGLMPLRHPIVTVVGAPIEVPKVAKPSAEMVDKYHAMYVDALVDLYNAHKDSYARDRTKSICIK